MKLIEGQLVVVRPYTASGNCCLNQHWATELFRAGCNVQRMQSLEVVVVLLRLYDDVQRAGCRIDDRRSGNADFDDDVAALTGVHVRNRCYAGRIDKALFRERARSLSVGIEGVSTVVFG